MLPAHIIEELRRREEYAREQERPRIHVPLPEETAPVAEEACLERSSEDARGVWVIDLFG